MAQTENDTYNNMENCNQSLNLNYSECNCCNILCLLNYFFQFATFLTGNREFFNQRAGYRTRGGSVSLDSGSQSVRSNPATVHFRQRAAQYIDRLSKVIILNLGLFGLFVL